MDRRFDRLFTSPENAIFQVVFFPDRIYHAEYLDATRSHRYRYNVHEVRSKAEVTALKAQVFLDGRFLANLVRIEYRGRRLVETAREAGRFLRERIHCWLRLERRDGSGADALLPLHYCRWIDAYQVELWETLEPAEGTAHDHRVLDQMGREAPITRVAAVRPVLADLPALAKVRIALREAARDQPAGWAIGDPSWDNHYGRNVQVPNTPEPSSPANTVPEDHYLLDFQRGWLLQAPAVAPVNYRNAMMNADDPRRRDDNIIAMRWILQQELGGTVTFFHEVTIPPGTVEGTHRHIGSEELYYIVRGEGEAYLGEHDDPAQAALPVIEMPLFGLDPRRVRVAPVRPGTVIFTKSGGIHGIRNTGAVDLVFVAFLYHSA
jgi:mannose-6-phosphate isomerase-like protein (cupin superfamily)